MTTLRTHTLRLAAMLLLAGALSACGFALRGSHGKVDMAFHSIYLPFPETSPLGTELARNLRGGDKVVVLSDPAKAEARFEVLTENRGKSILSLNSQGRVREYLLTYTLVFRVLDNKGVELLGPTEIGLKRNIPFNEQQVLAKETEEALLYRDMQSDLVQQILRRLAAIKPK